MAINVGQLVVDMRAETTALVGDLGKAERALGISVGKMHRSLQVPQQAISGLGRAFAAMGVSIGALSLGALVGQVRSLVEAVGGLGELSQQLGVTTDTLQALQYAAVDAGVGAEQLETGLARLTRTIGDAAAGEQEAIDAFERGGIEFLNYTGTARKTEDVLREVAERIKTATSEAERAAIATDFFGKSGQRLIPILMGGADGFDEYVRAAKQAGVMHSPEEIARMDAAADAWARWDYVMAKWGQTLAISVIGPIADWLDTSDQMLAHVREITDEMSASERALAATLNARAQRIGALPEWVGKPPFFDTGGDRGTTGFTGSAGIFPAPDGGGGDGAIREAERRAEAIRRVVAALELERDNLDRTAEEQRIYNELAKAGVDIASEHGQEIAALVSEIERRAEAEREMQELLAAEQALMEEGRALTESLRTPQEIYAAQLARLAELKAANAIGDETMARATAQYTEELQAAIGTQEEIAESTEELNVNVEQFGSLIADAALGLRDWGDVAKAVFQEAIQWLQQYIEMAASTKSLGGGGGLFDAILGLFGGGSDIGDGIFGSTGGFLHFGGPRAGGGPVSAGSAYLVGERGPELFMAAASGSILPTERLADLGGGGPVFHIDARGASVEAVARLEQMVARLHGSIEGRAVAAAVDARVRGGRVGAAFRR